MNNEYRLRPLARFACLLAIMLLSALAQAADMLPLWEARGARGTVYLFGSVHACNTACFPLPDSVLKRFDQSRKLALELDPGNPETQLKLMTAASIPPGQPALDRTLPADDLRRLRKIAAELGLPEEILFQFRPWMASSLLIIAAAQQRGLSPEQGVDVWLLQRAQARGMPVLELESAERQIAALSSGSAADQQKALRETMGLFERKRVGSYLEDMLAAWRKGDGKRIEALLNEGEAMPEAMRIELLDKRNVEMVARIEQWMQSGETLFAVVGMGHLVGPNNIPALLAKRGYTVKQLRNGE